MTDAPSPDLIFHNASIHTMRSTADRARAVAIADGRFVAVGGDEDVLALRGDATTVEDLGGATVIPGIVDAHNHMQKYGKVLRDADLYDVRSIEDALARLAEHASRLPPGTPVVGRGDCLHPGSLAEGRLPDRTDLDRVATDRLVGIADVNKTILNSFALERLTIDEGDVPRGGVVGRDETSGAPDGRFFYGAKTMTPLGAQSASLSEISLIDALRAGSRALTASGITSIVLPGADFDVIAALRELAARGELTVRVTAMPPVAALDEPERIAESGLACGAGDDMLRFGPLKVFHDGFLMHRTALMHEPFVGQPDNRGWRRQEADELHAIVRRASDAGWPVAVHVTGDRALDEAVEALAAVPSPRPTCPHHVIHAYFMTEAARETMARTGTTAALQPPFLRAWGDSVREFVGEGRAERFLPLRAYLDAGIACGASADAPIASPRPGLGIAAAVTRRAASGHVLGEREALSFAEAIHLYTRGGAAVTAEADDKGVIAAGALADFVVLDRDAFSQSGDELIRVPVRRTVLGGRTVFDAE